MFSNSFDPARLVILQDSWSWNHNGKGLVNGIPEESVRYLAQLFRIVSSNGASVRIPVGGTANFRSPTSTSPGTWVGATRTLLGIAPGETVQLQVGVWDTRAASYEKAYPCDFLSGASPVFDYVYSPSTPESPSDRIMKNFTGFYVSRPLTPCWAYVPRQSVTTTEDTAVPVPEPTHILTISSWFSLLDGLSATNEVSGRQLGRFVVEQSGVSYRPRPNTYGLEELTQVACCDELFTICSVNIHPSPKRPYLAVIDNDQPRPQSLVLRGLAPRRYRVEQSADLAAWTTVGEFTANTSEVPVRELSADRPDAQFFRAVEVAP